MSRCEFLNISELRVLRVEDSRIYAFHFVLVFILTHVEHVYSVFPVLRFFFISIAFATLTVRIFRFKIFLQNDVALDLCPFCRVWNRV